MIPGASRPRLDPRKRRRQERWFVTAVDPFRFGETVTTRDGKMGSENFTLHHRAHLFLRTWAAYL
jgi:hypothetical protein